MSYQVLARKWRPRNFGEMAGQEHVLRALINALDQGRLHQAYLFTGTRGVGKTTIARILAKALNCEQGVSAKPCGQCSACLEIDSGRFIDLIEVDAASRTKVEDTRELLDNVQYTPTRGRYKVYLIDEVHMLSAHSFNALLKTLEEPPPHVKFLLATTDPQKLPATILSRCLQFNLKRMSPDVIEERLTLILDSEDLRYDVASLKYLALAADGSMRDGLSLLDQAIAYCDGPLNGSDVAGMLGFVSREPVYKILRSIQQHDTESLLASVAKLEEGGADFVTVLDDLIGVLQSLAIAQWAPDSLEEDIESLSKLAETFSPEDIQLLYQISLLGKRDISLSPNVRRGFEMILLRMLAFRPATADITKPNDAIVKKNSVVSVDETRVELPETIIDGGGAKSDSETTEWQRIFQKLGIKGMVAELAANVDIDEWQDDTLKLLLSEQHAQLYNKTFEERLSETISDLFNKKVKIVINIGEPKNETPAAAQKRKEKEKLAQAVESIKQDTTVQALKDKFGAEVDLDSVRVSE